MGASVQYDVIVIGAGHNGLAAAIELADAGWSVLVVEAASEVGGSASTLEPLLPGYRHSPHANCLIFADVMPERFAPNTLEVDTVYPEAQFGIAFADGRPPVILHRHDLLARTKDSFSAYSRRDGTTYVKLKRRSERLGPVIRAGLYAPPDPRWFADQVHVVRRTYRHCCDMRGLGEGSARSVIDALFETPEVRMLLYHLAMETGLSLEERGSDVAFLGYALWVAGRWRIPLAGMGAYTRALARAAVSSGVAVACSTPVRRIVLAEGRVDGVETAAGEIIRASRAVIATSPILHTFDALLAQAPISVREAQELDAFRRQRPGSIATSFFCLDRAPSYRSARHDPAIDACLKTVIGHETVADVLAHDSGLRSGLLPRPAGVVRVHSLWDPTLAPQGRHVAAVDSAFPPFASLDAESWQMVEGAYPTAFLTTWSSYCSDAIGAPLASSCDVSSPFERRMLLRMGSEQYRSSISGLYIAGPGTYPGGGVHGACGRNSVRVLLGDNPR